ncbi:MAG: selenocysteine-specific translation elongation factor [bacterium]|nr:selenocysteine-specific translation elongation factor [bacterium]
MKHLIMGTGGHVDHGKTALVKALTDIECDTYKEEKRRGITINLGFAHLDLGSGESIGIVDVPGHRDFVHTMVGGASGIDFVLLVIAADSGVMPQTREHLRIMEILGVRKGLIALTKIDLIEDPQMLELTEEEIREFIKGTFLESAPVVAVSAKTRQGLDHLKESIAGIASQIDQRSAGGVFRMFIDRVFSVGGFGTVVTGSVMSGSLNVKDNVYLLPGKVKELQVRRLERHGKEVPYVKAGDRASINLTGVDKASVEKGMIITDIMLKETLMVDAQLELFEFMKKGKPVELGIWSQVMFHTGTYEKAAKVHLIDRDKLVPGETGLVQVHLSVPSVLRYGDRFVIRNSSSDITLGGGRVIDSRPLYHRRRPGKLLERMNEIAGAELPQMVASEVRKAHKALTAPDIAVNLNVSVNQIETAVKNKKKLPEDIVTYEGKGGLIFITKDLLENLRKGVITIMEEFQKQNPLMDKGVTFNEISGRLKIHKNSAGEEVLKNILDRLTRKGNLTQKDKTWKLPGSNNNVNQDLEDHIQFFSRYLKDSGMKVPLMNDLKRLAKERKLPEKQLKQVLYHLTSTKEAYRVKEEYIHADLVNNCREQLINWFSQPQESISVAQFRDLIGGNRKICLLLLAIYDSQRLTKRVGDVRVLAKGGKSV